MVFPSAAKPMEEMDTSVTALGLDDLTGDLRTDTAMQRKGDSDRQQDGAARRCDSALQREGGNLLPVQGKAGRTPAGESASLHVQFGPGGISVLSSSVPRLKTMAAVLVSLS